MVHLVGECTSEGPSNQNLVRGGGGVGKARRQGQMASASAQIRPTRESVTFRGAMIAT